MFRIFRVKSRDIPTPPPPHLHPQVLLTSAAAADSTVAATAGAALQRACMLNPSSFAAWLPLLFAHPSSGGAMTSHCVALLIVCIMKCSGSATELQQLSM